MLKDSAKLYRIIDANINRAKEGLRVCEDILRFIVEEKKLTQDFKSTRHNLDKIASKIFLDEIFVRFKHRDIHHDIGRKNYRFELTRKNYFDVFLANIQRAKESVRVLEEISKLKDARIALDFKKLRYRLYDLEKKSLLNKKIKSLFWQ